MNEYALRSDRRVKRSVHHGHGIARPLCQRTITRRNRITPEPWSETTDETRPNNTETLTFHHLLDLVIHFTSQPRWNLDEPCYLVAPHLGYDPPVWIVGWRTVVNSD